jgi:hypothetical protein
MVISLSIRSGPDIGKRIRLAVGETVCVGRGELADFSMPYDLNMSSKHFQIEFGTDGLRLKDLRSTNGTYLNGDLTSEAVLYDGDEIVAGETVFSVAWIDPLEDEIAADSRQEVPPSQNVTQPQNVAPLQDMAVRVPLHAAAAAACAGLQLTDEGNSLVSQDQSVAQLVEVLTRNAHHADALRVLSRALGTQAAVLWSSRCVEEVLSGKLTDQETGAIQAAQRWAAEPSPENTAIACESAGRLNNEGPAAMLALAAFWGAGSLTPPGQPVVPVDPQLPDQAISGALTLAAVSEPAADAPKRFESFIRSGQSFAESLSGNDRSL